MRAAIHQPDFMPWLGFFHKLSLVDTFIVFDHVQISMGKSWSSRNRVLLKEAPVWLTIPIIRKGVSTQAIFETRLNRDVRYGRKHLGTLKQAYGKCSFFAEVMDELAPIYEQDFEYLIDFNMAFIRKVIDCFGWQKKIMYSREILQEKPLLKQLKGNDAVLALCQAAGVTDYISGTGCTDFILPDSFEEKGIRFTFQEFKHPVYSQYNHRGEFVSHLSCLDALFNMGFDALRTVLTENVTI